MQTEQRKRPLTPPIVNSLIYPSAFRINVPTSTDIYPLSLHDALPISYQTLAPATPRRTLPPVPIPTFLSGALIYERSVEHTSELQSHSEFVWRPPQHSDKTR